MIIGTRVVKNNGVNLVSLCSAMREHFEAKGYDTSMVVGAADYTVSIKKGGIFRKVCGCQTALNVNVSHLDNAVKLQAKVGFFGMQFIPTVIMLFVAWPVIIPQIYGVIHNLNLDDEALDFGENYISSYYVTA